MKPTTMFTAAIVLAAGGAITTSALFASASGSPELSGAAAYAVQDTATSSFDSAVAAYDKAEADFKAKLGEASKKERKALRAKHPINDFWPRFEAMAQGGEGQALVWLADHIKTNRAIKSKDRPAALRPIYSALAASHVNADWFETALVSFSRDGRVLGTDTSMALIDGMLEKASTDKAKAAVLYHGAGAIALDQPEKSSAMLDRIIQDFGDTPFQLLARASKATPEDSAVGKVAPEFMASSLDGFEFNLSDYRGKVTVLDFYGFW